MLPYWYDAIVPDLLDRRLVLVSAHRNSLRALVKHLDGIPDDEIAELNLPTGVPLLYELNDRMRPSGRIDPQFGVSGTYLDPAAATASIAASRSKVKQPRRLWSVTDSRMAPQCTSQRLLVGSLEAGFPALRRRCRRRRARHGRPPPGSTGRPDRRSCEQLVFRQSRWHRMSMPPVALSRVRAGSRRSAPRTVPRRSAGRPGLG